MRCYLVNHKLGNLENISCCDKFFNWKTKDDTFKFTYRYGSVFSHKQIIKVHSTTINTNKKSVEVGISHRRHPSIRIRAFFKILKKDGSSDYGCRSVNLYLKSNRVVIGKYMWIEKLLNEKKGYLDEGALTVEYGLQVNSEKGEDGIWRFNLRDRSFDWKTKDDTFEFTYLYDSVFGHKQIIELHSTTIDTNKKSVPVPKLFDFDAFLMCLQITHGVRLQLTAIDYRKVARVAFHLGFSNTVRYCEEQLIVMEPKLNVRLLKLAVKCNMRCYLVHLLKRIDTKKQLIDFLKKLELEEMSSESMKAIVAKIFSF